MTILSNSPSSTQFTVGIGISGYPAYASQIFPFSLQSFHPTGAYYIAFSPYLEAGTVLSPSVLNKAQLTGSTVTAVYTPDQVWTVTPGSGF